MKRKGVKACAPCSLRRLQCDNEDPCGPCKEAGRQCKRFNRRALPSSSNQQLQRGPNAVSALADQLLGLFLEPYLWRPEVHFQWLSDLPVKRTESQALANSLLALSTAHMAGQKHDPALWRDALLLYNRATRKLQRDIANPALATSDLTLAACTALWQYLRSVPIPQPEHLLVHLRGVTEILRLRGPASFRSGFARRLLFTLHNGISGTAMMRQEDTLLADTEWIAVTLAEEPEDNIRPVDRLKVVNLARLARIRSRYAAFLTQNSVDPLPSASAWISLINDAWTVIASLSKLIHMFPGRPLRLVPTFMPIITTYPTPFPESYEFDSARTAIELVSASAGMATLYNILWQSYETLAQLPGVHNLGPEQGSIEHAVLFSDLSSPGSKQIYKENNVNQATLLQQVAHCKAIARRLGGQTCMSIQHCLEEDHVYFGRIPVLYPLNLARRVFAETLPESAPQLDWSVAALILLSTKDEETNAPPSPGQPEETPSPSSSTPTTSVQRFRARTNHVQGLWKPG